MSYQASNWALREAPVGGDTTARLLLMALADRAHPDGTAAWPSVATLMKELQVSESTVRRKLSKLESLEVIRRGDQYLARRDGKGNPIPGQYRPVVWDLCMGVKPEPVAEPKSQDRGVKMTPQEEPQDDTWEEAGPGGVILTPLEEEPVSRGVTGASSGVSQVTGKPKDKPITPLPPKGGIPPKVDSSAGMSFAARFDALLEECGMPARREQVRSSNRELAAASAIVATGDGDRALKAARWALTEPSGFWRPTLTTCRSLEKHWVQIALQQIREIEQQAKDKAEPKKDPKEPPKDPHAPIKVTSLKRVRVPVYGFGKLGLDASRNHLDGTVSPQDCPVCAFDGRNLNTHWKEDSDDQG